MLNKFKNYASSLYKKLYENGSWVQVVALILLVLALLALGIGIGLGFLYLAYISLLYLGDILYNPLSTKLKELGYWGFVLLTLVFRWVLNVIASPFKSTKKDSDD